MTDDASTSSGMSKPPEMEKDGTVDKSNLHFERQNSFKNRYWKYHLAGSLWIPYFAAFLVALGLSSNFQGGADGPVASAVMWFFVLVWIPLLIVGGFMGTFAYYYDSKDIRKTASTWTPLWWFWTISHIIMTPAITSPIYLIRRRWKVGSPRLTEIKSALVFWRSSASLERTATN